MRWQDACKWSGFFLGVGACYRAAFLIWNHSLFGEETWSNLLWAFIYGLRFDAVVAALALILVWLCEIFLPIARRYVIATMVLVFGLISSLDTELYNFFGRRLSLSTLEILASEANGKVAASLAGYALGVAIGAVLLALLIWVSVLLESKAAARERNLFFWLEQAGLVLVLAIAARGGLQKKPLTIISADFADRPMLTTLVLNSPFTLFKSLSAATLERSKFFKDPEEPWVRMRAQQAAVTKSFPHPKEPTNVVMIIMEGMSWEYTGAARGEANSATPFLDQLSKRSLTFDLSFANGRRSIEGVPAILAGVPSLMDQPYIKSEFATAPLHGIAEILGQNGYETLFFHGGDNGTMHFDDFTQKIGFRKYFGRREYGDDSHYDGVWGIYDRPYLQYVAKNLNRTTEPFLGTVFTLSAHPPYNIPTDEAGRFTEGPHPMIRAVRYADDALKDFFATAEKSPWYSRTLFVLAADHTGPRVFFPAQDLVSAYRIPILFFQPGREWPTSIDRNKIARQVDIAPTIYDFLGFNDVKRSIFGRSLLTSGPATFVGYRDQTYVATDGKTTLVHTSKLNRFTDFEKFEQNVQPKLNLEVDLKAARQVFNDALWLGRLYDTPEKSHTPGSSTSTLSSTHTD